MSVKALQDYTYVSKYARYSPEKKRRRTWNETQDIVAEMHISQFPQVADEIRWAFAQSKKKIALGSQRVLQYAGEPVLRKNARAFNCTVSYVDRIRFFQEALWLLLCGCGTGFSVQTHHLAKLPDFHSSLTIKSPDGAIPERPKKIHVIEDSIEGWADALGILMATYFPHAEFSAKWDGSHQVEFEYFLIRPKGSALSSGAGKAPGPEPLRLALDSIRQLLDRCLKGGQTRLRSIDAYDVIMHASDSVIAGGVRRSASICLFSPHDTLMAKAKTGNWFKDNPQRGRSNNSAMLLRDSTSREQFHELMVSVKEFGEPGFVWSDSTEALYNPCVEIGMFPVDEQGNSGWSFCNLSEINGKKCRSKEDLFLAAKAAAIIGTLQAAYTKFDYLGPVSEAIARREALLGVSITGMMDSPDVLFNPEIQREAAQIVVKTNEEIAAKIGINAAARCTCVKPAGTTSLVLGTSSGIHAHHAPRYIRRIQANVLEAPYQFYVAKNPRAGEMSVWSRNGTDAVVAFCVETQAGSRTRKEIDALTLLEHVRLTQNNWVAAGKVKSRCAQPWLRHNVSNTITVRPEEWEAVEEYIYENRVSFAGISLLSASGDLDYPQAPFTAIKTEDELVKEYGKGVMFASGMIVDGQHAFDGNLWDACDLFNSGVSDALKTPEHTDFIRFYALLDDDFSRLNPEFDRSAVFKAIEQGTSESIVGPESYLVSVLERGAKLFGSLNTFQIAMFSPWKSVEANHLQSEWLRRAFQYAFRYFRGDTRKMAYCLKEVSNFKLWCDLRRENVEVDFSEMIEEQDDTKIQDTVACAGGTCDL
jgi:ribonucleoside-triphosphate reductase